ncbi:acyl-CoA dehydrogenase [Frankia sp. R43]|uniref:acyl-CoA dehydrogenase family protein n=1 Tax=Frankia sp. R43 TaxID=269536 RepID=UPI0006C9FF7F|nr:acyl-CoA dehydrogenase family protein [Frankia sp. R43]KPM54362.1 acyl-CoA dehydrogenase [Frankia sp. R43]
MSQFDLTDAQRAFADQVRDVATAKLVHVPSTEGRVNRPLLRQLGELGLLRALFGGQPGEEPRDAAAMQLCLLRETLATVSTEAETALALQGLGSYPILQSGSPGTVRRWIPGVVTGEVIAAFALSEPEAGSDAAALALRADPDPDGDGWRLTGRKTWISNAPWADVYTVFARTRADGGARGVTAFAVPGDAPGLTGEPLDMLSPHPLGTLDFDGVRVGRADVLGEVDAGFRVAMRTLDLFRPSVGAFAVGMAQAALDAAVDWTARRQAFGGPLSAQQSVAHTLADLATRVQAARLLVRAAAAAYDGLADGGAANGGAANSGPAGRAEITRSAAMAKLFATEAAQVVVDQALQLHGARGLQRGHLLEHLYRDVRAPRIYEGASEIQRTIIARSLYARAAAAADTATADTTRSAPPTREPAR